MKGDRELKQWLRDEANQGWTNEDGDFVSDFEVARSQPQENRLGTSEKRQWAKVLSSWISQRKIEGQPLREQVWKELEPLRNAMRDPKPKTED